MNLALRSLFAANKKARIISTRAEHSCVYETLLNLQSKGADVHFLPVNQSGQIDLNELEQLLPADGVVFSYANSETGARLDIERVSDLLQSYQTPFLLDAVTWPGKELVQLPQEIDFACFSAHKFHAPQGVGFAVFSEKLNLQPLVTGGGQEQSLRSGTPNLAGIVALAKAFELCQQNAKQYSSHLLGLQKRFEKALQTIDHPTQIHGNNRICNTSCVYFEGVDAEGLFINLDMQGIVASIGSACSSGSLEPSRVLLEMGLSHQVARNSLRFSFSRFNTTEEIDRAIVVLKECLQKQITYSKI